MVKKYLTIKKSDYESLISFLLPNDPQTEEAGFVFTDLKLNFKKWLPMHSGDYVSKSMEYLELKDWVRADVIKQAHDTNSILVEFHSHPFPWPAKFSLFDLEGLSEIAPHIRWRLKNKPYVAIVVAPGGYDALIWDSTNGKPSGLGGIKFENQLYTPTGLTLKSLEGK